MVKRKFSWCGDRGDNYTVYILMNPLQQMANGVGVGVLNVLTIVLMSFLSKS